MGRSVHTRPSRMLSSVSMSLSITWLGHATFLLQSPGGKKMLFDPWITGNPTSPESAKKLGALDLMLITHGHHDHTADAVSVGRSSVAHVVAPFAVAVWLREAGAPHAARVHPRVRRPRSPPPARWDPAV